MRGSRPKYIQSHTDNTPTQIYPSLYMVIHMYIHTYRHAYGQVKVIHADIRGVVVIVVGIVHSDPSSNTERNCLYIT